MGMAINVYQGNNNHTVTVNGRVLNPKLSIRNHSPTGFAWGYQGSGPSQLALAIMVNEYGEALEDHPVHYQEFKREVIAGLKGDFTLTSEDITEWLKRRQSQ